MRGERWIRITGAAALVGALLGTGCKGGGGLGEGEPCHGSSECAPGLVCDFAQSPPRCAPSGSVMPMVDAADLDAPAADAPAAEVDAPSGAPDAAPPLDAPPDA